ncbi:MAG: thioredoxin family protein [Anaerolineae bacterium]|nr:thioredoxin family protein [Anaerolineae bacterium]
MLNVKILGPGCVNCYRVEQVAVDALEMLDEEATLQHITDQEKMRQYGIMYTPGLVINEQLVCAGRIPSIKEVISWAEEALAREENDKSK